MILSQWSNPADSERNIQWTRQFFEAMQPFLERGAYINLMGEEGEEVVREAYGSNYDRLAALKAKYDPTNFFSLNHNIKPTTQSGAMF
jgi:FAD/FMN-containing dehydrogenase